MTTPPGVKPGRPPSSDSDPACSANPEIRTPGRDRRVRRLAVLLPPCSCRPHSPWIVSLPLPLRPSCLRLNGHRLRTHTCNAHTHMHMHARTHACTRHVHTARTQRTRTHNTFTCAHMCAHTHGHTFTCMHTHTQMANQGQMIIVYLL